MRIAPSFLDALLLPLLLSFELYGRQHPVSSVFTFRIVEHFAIVEHIPPCVFSGFVCAAPDAFSFQQVKETLCHSGVMKIFTSIARQAIAKQSAERRLMLYSRLWSCRNGAHSMLVNCEP